MLEIETDKAQIDVEAADDGILAKIYEQNGAKEIPVGKTIAVLAEPGDDVATLELPKPEAGGVAGQSSAPKEEPKPAKKEEPKAEPEVKAAAPSKTSVSGRQAADAKQTLLPSVSGLLSANGISKEDAFKNIKATGPSGRLLKGDVLVYLGKASGESLEKLDKEISKNSKLDLSNIEIKSSKEQKSTAAAPSESAKDAKSDTAPVAAAKPEPVILKQVFSLGDLELLQSTVAGTLGSSIELTKLVEKASKAAYRDIKEFTKPKRSSLYDPLFESIVAPRSSGKPFEISFEYPKQTIRRANKSSEDIFSLLSSSKGYSTPVSPRVELSDLLKVTLKINDKAPGAVNKAQVYLDRLNFYLGEGKGDLLL